MKEEIAQLKAKIEALKNSKEPENDDEENIGDDDDDTDDQISELEEMMRNQLQKLQGFKKTNDDLKNEREEIDKKREEVLANAGLISSTASNVFNADNNTINLINISDDPSISNCLVYFMHNGKNTLGTDNENKVVLKGLGISERHATLTNDNDDKLYLEPLDSEFGKVSVNGKQISSKTELHHLDRIVFGHGNAFKVIIPLHKDEAARNEEAVDYNSIMQDRLANDTTEAKNMRKYLEELRERLGEKKGMQFVIKFQQALDELDEANEYSKARYMAFPLDKNYIIFTIEIMVDIKEYVVNDPEIVVRCRNRNSNEILFLWSYSKFKQRLELMTEWYADLKDDGILDKDYTIDPWIDISDSDIKRKVDEKKEMSIDKIRKLKDRLEDEKSKLELIKKNQNSCMTQIERLLSKEEKAKLDTYIEVELFKRKCTEEEKLLVQSFNSKSEDFKKLVFNFHTEDTNRIDKILTIKEIEEKITKLEKSVENEENKEQKEVKVSKSK